MNTFENSCGVLLPHDGVQGNERAPQTPAKTHQCFADVAALVGNEEQAKTDKNVADKTGAGTQTVPEQGALCARNRKSRSTPGNGPAAAAAALSGQAAAVPQIEHAQAPPAGNSRGRSNAGPNVPLLMRPAPKDDSPADVRKLDQIALKTSSARQDRTSEGPPKSLQRPAQFRRVGHEPAPSKREDRPIGQHHQTQVAGPDDKKAPPELGTDGAKTPMEPGAVAVSQPAAAVPHSSGQTPIPGIVEMRTDPSVVQTVSEQILDSVRASVTPGEGQISVRLQPPELGMVTVRLRERGEWLEGTLEVEKSDTRREIERTLPEVVRGLQDAGIQVHKLDVTGSDSPKPDLGSGAGPQDGGSAQNGPGQNRDHLPASHTPGLQENVNYLVRLEETAATGRLISASPGRIDMLL